LKTLDVVHRQALGLCCRAVKWAPILAVREMPLEIRRKQLAAILGTSSRPTKAALQPHWDHVLYQRSSYKKVPQQSFPFACRNESCRNCVAVTNNPIYCMHSCPGDEFLQDIQ